MKIQKARLKDANSFFKIIMDCKITMKENNIEQWPDHYPSKEIVNSGIANGDVYVALIDNKIVGGVKINNSFDEPYNTINWQTNDKKPLIVHQLAVDPKEQGKGIAKELIHFAENFAKENGSKSIRLDTYKNNLVSNNFYKKMGYKLLGTISQPEYMPGKYNCYEKVI